MNIGDRVRITQDATSDGSNAWCVGREGTVIKTVNAWVIVQVDDDTMDWRAFLRREVEPL